MLESLHLRNLKSFRDSGEIPLRPITVLAGPNSTGKSSVLQALLLLKQTLESEVSASHLVLDGRYLQFSAFNDLAFDRPPISRAEIEVTAVVSGAMNASDVRPYHEDWPTHATRDWAPYEAELTWRFRFMKISDIKSDVVVSSFGERIKVFGLEGTAAMTRLPIAKRYQVELGHIRLGSEYPGRTITGAGFRHFLPDHLLLQPGSHSVPGGTTLAPLPAPVAIPLADLRDTLEHGVNYLGPLRDEPRRAYLHSGLGLPQIGQRGEFAAQVLWLEKSAVVPYRPSPEGGMEEAPLLEAVNDAFARLGVHQKVSVQSDKSVMYQLLFGLRGDDSKHVTIADVGFGVSQLLPVIVLTLRSPAPSLLLFEQPEIHLHPRLQANLADFFIAASSMDKRVLIETHSDHFINRLRRRIAEDQTDELRERVSILFVEPSDGGARIDPLEIDQFGVIQNWPPEFLPEAADEAEAIIRAGLAKRRR